MRVLIVEDSPAEAETFADLVAHHGHDPLVAASAEAALDTLAKWAPDAVLLDISLPGMNGLELTRQLHVSHPEIRVLIITGHEPDRYYAAAITAGADDLITKDDANHIVREVKKLLI